MSDVLRVGKLPQAVLKRLLADGPPLPREIALGPAIGEDACAIAVPEGTLVAATDPITLTGHGVGAHAVVVNANDVAVMGVRPRWFLAVMLLPEGTRREDVDEIFAATRRALSDVGASLVGGHTEVTSAVTQPVVVGQMLGFAEDGRFVTSGGARPGHGVVQIGPAPVEGAAVLAAEAGERLAGVEPEVVERARRALTDPGISVVEPALLAAELGASALHDPTEGGLAAGLAELAQASGVALRVEAERVLWFEPGRVLCRAVGADPWGTLASGTLLAAFPPERLAAALAAFRARDIPACELARAEVGRGIQRAGGQALPVYERDEVARVLSETPAS